MGKICNIAKKTNLTNFYGYRESRIYYLIRVFGLVLFSG